MMVTGRLLGLLGLVIFLVGTASGQELTVQKTPGGLEYWHYAMTEAKRSAVAITWKHRLPENSSHIVASRLGINLMVNGGADGKSPSDIIAAFEDLDGGSRLFVQPREIRGFIVAPDEKLGKAAEIANGVLARPNLDEKWFAREKKKLADKAANRANNVYGIGWNLARAIMLKNHPFRQYWSLSPVEAIEELTLGDVKRWHEKALSREGIKITVAGSIAPQKVGELIDNAVAGLPNDANPSPLPFDAPHIAPVTIVFHKPDLPKSLVLLIGKLPPPTLGRDVEFNLATGVLGLGKQSRLFTAVRTGMRAAYGFSAFMPKFTRDYRALVMSGEVETALLQKTLEELNATYSEFRTSGVGFLEMPFAKRFYTQRIEKEKRKPSSVAYMMMENIQNNRPIEELSKLEERIDNLGRAELNAMILSAYPTYDSLLKLIITPDADVVKDACVITEIAQWERCLKP